MTATAQASGAWCWQKRPASPANFMTGKGAFFPADVKLRELGLAARHAQADKKIARSATGGHGAARTRMQTLVGHLWLSENLCGFRILILLHGFYGNARHKPCESNEADRYQVIAAPPLMHRKGHAGSRDQRCYQP
jgi:hypothetical protein